MTYTKCKNIFKNVDKKVFYFFCFITKCIIFFQVIPGSRHAHVCCCCSSSSSLLVMHFPSLLLSPTSFLTSHLHLKFRLAIFYFVKKNCLFFSISYFFLASYFILSCQFQPHLTFSISTVTQSSPLSPQLSLSTSLSSLTVQIFPC
jgi:hypothetical protein